MSLLKTDGLEKDCLGIYSKRDEFGDERLWDLKDLTKNMF